MNRAHAFAPANRNTRWNVVRGRSRSPSTSSRRCSYRDRLRAARWSLVVLLGVYAASKLSAFLMPASQRGVDRHRPETRSGGGGDIGETSIILRERSKMMTKNDVDKGVVNVGNDTKPYPGAGAVQEGGHGIGLRASLMNPSNRGLRFPSVDERVRLYMSEWYYPPCRGDDARDSNQSSVLYFFHRGETNHSQYKLTVIDGLGNPITPRDSSLSESIRIEHTFILPDVVFHVDHDTVEKCATSSTHLSRAYCRDLMKTMFPSMVRVNWHKGEGDTNGNETFPLFVQFGDKHKSLPHGYLTIPHFKKVRPALTSQERATVKAIGDVKGCIERPPAVTTNDGNGVGLFQPMVWRLNINRHYANLRNVQKYDIEWDRKKDTAIFRGDNTGPIIPNSITDGKERCFYMTRCRLVYLHHNSTLVDAKLTSTGNAAWRRVPDVLDGVYLLGGRMTVQEMLQYKVIIMLEGNDVSSGLKWALFSKSVVMMQPAKWNAWAMEELLEPWVHYVPLNEDLTDVEEKTQWILDNEEEAQAIAFRGSLWINDLIFHEDAKADEEKIFDEMLRRYRTHYE